MTDLNPRDRAELEARVATKTARRVKHRWWHPTTWVSEGKYLTLFCERENCSMPPKKIKDDGHRCAVCGSPTCDPMEHH